MMVKFISSPLTFCNHAFIYKSFYISSAQFNDNRFLSSRSQKVNLEVEIYEAEEIKLQERIRDVIHADTNKVTGALKAHKMLQDFILSRRRELLDNNAALNLRKLQHKDSFRILLDAWVKISLNKNYKEDKAGQRAEEVLALYISDLMYHLSIETEWTCVRGVPLKAANNVDIFTRVLKVWSGNYSIFSVHRIMEILFYMEQTEIFQRENEGELRTVIGQVDTVNYNIGIKAWSMSEYPWKAQKAYDLLCRMEQRSQKYPFIARCGPDIISFTSVIEACGKTSSDQETYRKIALEVLVETWQKLNLLEKSTERNIPKRNHSTYGAYLRSCASLQSSKDICIDAFNEARDAGFVSKFVLDQFRRGVSREVFDEVTKNRCLDDIPMDWKSNVKDTRFRSRYSRR